MSADIGFLAFRLEGPLQAWGFESQFSRRNSGLWPTKSGILGMCCAAIGIARGSERERELLARCVDTRLLVVALPRIINFGATSQRPLSIRRITDYHTVQGTRRAAGGKPKDTHLTWRQYLCDGAFGAVLSADRSLIDELRGIDGRAGIENPMWGLWLGRKACIPTAPVFAGVAGTREAALGPLLGDIDLNTLSRMEEVDEFGEGVDSLPDQPLSFANPDGLRQFTLRRVRLHEARK
jgi:CRISPR system Cascade subunit CasD